LIDPDRHQIVKKQLPSVVHHKLHGWHPARWVRRYGVQRSEELVQRVARLRGSSDAVFLILSHSGRIEEYEIFSKAIDNPER
jgi:hypothetical protein